MRLFQIGLFWSTLGEGGGAGRVLETLTEYLPKHGVDLNGAVRLPHNVEALTGGRLKLMAPAEARGLGRLLTSRATTLRLINESKPDVLASHFAMSALPIFDHLKDRPFVVHFHGPWAEESRVQGSGTVWLKYAIERLVYGRADRVITLSAAFAGLLVRDYKIEPSRIHIIPGAVDLERFHLPASKQEARAKLGWPVDRPILVTVRRLVQRMGLDNLLQAVHRLKEKHPDILLYICGRGPMKAELQSSIVRLQLERHVVLTGFVADEMLPVIYQAANLNIVPTISLEGFGLVAAEALASGTPSMVTPIGGLPEIVRPLSKGLIFHSSSAEHIAEGIDAALSGAVYVPDAPECRAYAQHHFSADLMAQRTAEVYGSLTGLTQSEAPSNAAISFPLIDSSPEGVTR